MKSEVLFNPLRNSMRQGDLQGAEFHLNRLMKSASDSNCVPRLRTEIHLEAIKTHRAANRSSQAEQMCDVAIANIPSDARDLLSALKRVRALLFLDAGDALAARHLIEQADGLELVLQGGHSLISPVNENEINIETWLVSTEVAVAQNDIPAAQNFFEKALNRLSADETNLRHKRISPFDRRKLEQYYHDLSQMLTLYGSTLSCLSGDANARQHLTELFDLVSEENKIAFLEKKLPNVPLQSMLTCLLGKWSGEAADAPGICLAEARRWATFSAPENFQKLISPNVFLEETPVSEHPSPVSALTVFPNSGIQSFAATPPADPAITMALSAFERLTGVLEGISGVLPEVKSYMRDGATVDYSKRGWSGHLLDTDLQNFIKNIYDLRYTGYVRLAWRTDLYESAIIRGYLPDTVREGCAFLYAVQGCITDTVFKSQSRLNTVEVAQDNFITIARMCYSIQVNNIQPDIIGYVTPDEGVADRKQLIRINENSLMFIIPELEEIAEGSGKQLTFWDSQGSDDDDEDDDYSDFGGVSSSKPIASFAEVKTFSDPSAADFNNLSELQAISVQKVKPLAKAAQLGTDDLLEL